MTEEIANPTAIVNVALFAEPLAVQAALRSLRTLGVPLGEITVLATDPEIESYLAAHAEPDDTSIPGGATGAVAGGAMGTAMSVIPIALSGLAIAPIFVLVGLASGVLAGSFAGSILGAGYKAQQLETLEHAIAHGQTLMVVHSSADQSAGVQAALEHAGGKRPEIRTAPVSDPDARPGAVG